jgi:hypothetical protein
MVDEILFGKIEKGGLVRIREKKQKLVFEYNPSPAPLTRS